MPRRTMSAGRLCVRLAPSRRMSPFVSVRPRIESSRVDLPAPFGPMIPTMVPASTSSDTPCRERAWP